MTTRRVVAEHVPRLRRRRQQDRVSWLRDRCSLCYRLIHDSSFGAGKLSDRDIGGVSREYPGESHPVGADQHRAAQPRRGGRYQRVKVGIRATEQSPG